MYWFGSIGIDRIRESLGYITYRGLSYKAEIASMTSYSQVARLISVGSPETVGTNLGRCAYYEADSAIKPGIGRHPVNLFGLLQRLLEGE